MDRLSNSFEQILGTFRISMQQANIPEPMVTIQAFQAALAQALDESRSSLEPFSVLLLSVSDLEESAQAMGSQQYENLLRQIGLHVMASLRTKVAPAFPPRQLDIVAWWGCYFIAICYNADRERGRIPAGRVISKVEKIMPSLTGESDVLVRLASWSWSWRTSHQNETAVMQQLMEALTSGTGGRIEEVAEASTLENRMASILDRFERE